MSESRPCQPPPPTCPSGRPAPRPVRHPPDRRRLPARQLPRRGPALGGDAGRRRVLLLPRRPARPHRACPTPRTCAAAPARRPPSCSPWASTPRAAPSSRSRTCREHAELAWVLGCLTGFGEASRMTQFKEKGRRRRSGLFTYPVLQAADILMYQADSVPIGEDQRQHLELTRDLAQRFNARYGETFVVPGPYVGKAGARIKDLQEPDPQDEQERSAATARCGCSTSRRRSPRRSRARSPTPAARSCFDVEGKPGVSNLLTILAGRTGTPVEQVQERLRGQGLRRLQGRGRRGGRRAVRARSATRYAELHGRPGRARPRAGRRRRPGRRGRRRHDGVGARPDRPAGPARRVAAAL